MSPWRLSRRTPPAIDLANLPSPEFWDELLRASAEAKVGGQSAILFLGLFPDYRLVMDADAFLSAQGCP